MLHEDEHHHLNKERFVFPALASAAMQRVVQRRICVAERIVKPDCGLRILVEVVRCGQPLDAAYGRVAVVDVLLALGQEGRVCAVEARARREHGLIRVRGESRAVQAAALQDEGAVVDRDPIRLGGLAGA